MSTPAAVVRVRILTSAVATRADLLGPDGKRVWHLNAPQNTPRPYLVYGIVGGAPVHHLLGAGGLWQGRVLVECYCDKASQMEEIGEALRLTCDAYRGTVAVGTDSYDVRRLHIVNESEGVIYPDPAKPLAVFMFSKELELDVFQSIPSY
jgi:hypothetical protein